MIFRLISLFLLTAAIYMTAIDSSYAGCLSWSNPDVKRLQPKAGQVKRKFASRGKVVRMCARKRGGGFDYLVTILTPKGLIKVTHPASKR